MLIIPKTILWFWTFGLPGLYKLHRRRHIRSLQALQLRLGFRWLGWASEAQQFNIQTHHDWTAFVVNPRGERDSNSRRSNK